MSSGGMVLRMTPDQFAEMFGAYFGLGGFGPSLRSPRIWGLTSLMWFECLEMLEEAAGHAIEPDALGADPTVLELYRFLGQVSGDPP